MRASVKGLSGTFTGSFFFGRRNISFRFGQFVSLLTEAIFSFNFWETASIVSLGEAKNGFIFWDQFLASSLEPESILFGICGR